MFAGHPSHHISMTMVTMVTMVTMAPSVSGFGTNPGTNPWMRLVRPGPIEGAATKLRCRSRPAEVLEKLQVWVWQLWDI